MALRDLVEGECGGPSSLMQLTSHFVKDHGLKDEGVRDLFDQGVPFESDNQDQLVKQFLEETAVYPQTFKMENLLHEVQDINQSIYPPVTAPRIVDELINQDTAWANQYLQSGGHFKENHTDDIWNPPITSANAKVAFPGETSELGLGPKWAEEYLEQSIDTADATKNSTTVGENPNFTHSKLMKFMRQEGDVPLQTASIPKTDTLDDTWTTEFTENEKIESTNSDKTKESEASVLSAIDEQSTAAGTWVSEYLNKDQAEAESEGYDTSFWERLQNEWKTLSTADSVSSSHPWISEYENFYDPFKEYSFSEENPMCNLANPLDEGKQRLEKGDLVGAVLCFEAAAKQEPTNAECWLLLGKTQAENEQDPLAISALKQCLTIDPNNLPALMALAVSYTNESYQSQACLVLKDWLLKNDKYKHLSSSTANVPPAQQLGVSTILFSDVHSEVKDLFIQAARMQPSGTIDADVQNGLGILFNLSSEYDKAADCFRAALQVNPKNPMLWNRLGAILANSQNSEEAIDAYHHALELSPGLIRARYNLGISCMNLNCYKEAGEHFLTALNQQAAAKGAFGEKGSPRIMSNTIWSTLRLVLSFLHKYELSEAVDKRDLERLNHEFGIE